MLFRSGLTVDGLCNERKRLGIVVASKILSEKELFFKLKEAIEQVTVSTKNIAPTFVENNDINKYEYVHPTNSASIQLNKQEIGYFSVLNPRIRNNIDKKLSVAFAEIDIEEMEKIDVVPLEYREVSKYPGVTVDLSLLVDKKTHYEQLSKYLVSRQLIIAHSLAHRRILCLLTIMAITSGTRKIHTTCSSLCTHSI